MLPPNDKPFTISVVGETTGKLYEGAFTCVCVPTIAMRNRIHRDEARETGDLINVDRELLVRARWLSNAQNRIISGPEWWNGTRGGSLLQDDNVLKELYDKCLEAELEWRTTVKTQSAAVTAASTAQATTPAST